MKSYTLLVLLLMSSFSAFAIFGNDGEEKDHSAIDKMNHFWLSFRSVNSHLVKISELDELKVLNLYYFS